jgi:hypothetical protein
MTPFPAITLNQLAVKYSFTLPYLLASHNEHNVQLILEKISFFEETGGGKTPTDYIYE